MRLSGILGIGVFLSAALVLFLWPGEGVRSELPRAAALTVFAIGFWASGLWPGAVTSLTFFLIAMLMHVAPAHVVFSGFHSTAFWLVLGGMILGVAVKQTGLGNRLAARLLGCIGSSYLAVISGIVLLGMVLAFLMPSSMGRMLLMMPVVLELADRLGFKAHGRGRAGLVLAAGMVSFMPASAILPAAVPNIVLAGAAEAQYGIHLRYLNFLMLHLPAVGILKALIIIGVCWAMFREEPAGERRVETPSPVSRDEFLLSIVLLVALLLWLTDFLHEISPAWIALGAGLCCLLPGVNLVPSKAFAEKVNFTTLIYLAGLLGLGAVVSHSGLAEAMGGVVLKWLPLEPGAPATNFVALSGLATLVGIITTLPGAPVVFTPMVGGMVEASGLPMETVLMIQVVGYSTLILPYQAPPLVVAMQLGDVSIRRGARLTLAVAGISVLTVWPLTYAWWRFLDIF